MQLASLPNWLGAPTTSPGTNDERRDLIRLFRALLLLHAGFGILITPVMLKDREALPEDLQAYVAEIVFDRIFLLAAGITFILSAALLAGLWYFKPWARLLYSLLVAAAMLICWYQGAPDVRSASVSLASDLAAMSTGAVVVFIWGVLRREFGGPPYPIGAEKADQ
jgi:hypothetical protein